MKYTNAELEAMSVKDLEALHRDISAEAGRLDTLQLSLKIFINSIYGTFANRHSPFYDIDAASSITLTGQACVKQSSEIIEQFARERDIDTDLTVYGDTDSVYFTITPILEKLGITLLNEDETVTDDALKLTEDIEEFLNEEITNWATRALNTIDSRFVFKREAICSTGLFLQKKRYILDVRNDEGIDTKKCKFVGVEVARSSFSDPVKEIIKDIVAAIFKYKSESEVNRAYREGYDKFKSLQPDDISIRVSLKNYEKYADVSEGWEIAKKTPVHVKGAIYFNNLLDRHDITSKYEKLTTGQKVKWFYCDQNPYQINVLSYLDKIPEEIYENIQPNYKQMFNKLISSNIQRMVEACNWTLDDLEYSYTTSLLDFLTTD